MNLILTLIWLASASIAGENAMATDDSCCPILFTTEEFNVSYDPLYYQLYFTPISYDLESGSFRFESKKKISYVELTSEDGEKTRLLVLSQKIQLNKSMFKGKDATIAFHFEADNGQKEAFAVFLDYKR